MAVKGRVLSGVVVVVVRRRQRSLSTLLVKRLLCVR